jgi:rod shape determining protein RodA
MLLLSLRLCATAYGTRDLAGRLIVIGVASQLFFQTFVNVGMNLGVMPITGVTLPFVSLGGSSLWTSCIAIALVQNVGLYRHRIFPF